jgi:hypothetical protein
MWLAFTCATGLYLRDWSLPDISTRATSLQRFQWHWVTGLVGRLVCTWVTDSHWATGLHLADWSAVGDWSHLGDKFLSDIIDAGLGILTVHRLQELLIVQIDL